MELRRPKARWLDLTSPLLLERMECKMRILIAAVGRAKAGPERALFEHYQARMKAPFCLQLREVEEKSKRVTRAC